MPDAPPLSPEILGKIPSLTDPRVDVGYVLDAAGVRTRRLYRGAPEDAPGVLQLKVSEDNWEWIPLTWAAATAGDSLVAVELGAGWGPWMSRTYSMARKLGVPRRKIFGVEAEPAHFGYLKQHMIDKDIPSEDAVLFQGLIAVNSGVALFPLTKTPEKSWGLRQVGREGASAEEVLACR